MGELKQETRYMISYKKLLIASAVTGVVGTGIITSSVMAATNGSSSYPPIVQKIANTFHLNAADVQQVFDQNKQDRQAKREQKLKDNLDQLVKAGTITQDQEDKIIAKLKDLRQSLKSDNRQERVQNRDNFKTQMEQWLKDNGINVSLDQLLPPNHDGWHRRHGGV